MSRASWIRLSLLGAAVALALVLVEIGCQLYGIVIYRRFAQQRASPQHYYQPSHNSVLAYELSPGDYVNPETGNRLHINRHGIRDDADEPDPARRRVAILGDSVTFGIGHSQEFTIAPSVQRELLARGEDAHVLNFGVPGYALGEIVEQLRVKDAVYDVDTVVYLLNPNDFARRNTVYEGADNGLYRTYRRPKLMTPWFVRKAIYRWNKKPGEKGATGPHWYRWMFEGTREHGFDRLSELKQYADREGIELWVVLFPVGSAYIDGAYALQGMYDQIGTYLDGQGIRYSSPVDLFGAAHFDLTDHLTDEGNILLAERIADLVSRSGVARIRIMPR